MVRQREDAEHFLQSPRRVAAILPPASAAAPPPILPPGLPLRRRVLTLLGSSLLVLLSPFLPPCLGEEACRRTVPISDEMRVAVEQGREIYLEVRPEPGEEGGAFAERLTGSESPWEEIRGLNGGQEPSPERFFRVPFERLAPPYRLAVLLGAFPGDRLEGEEWVHRVLCGQAEDHGESLVAVAAWLTGDGGRAVDIALRSGLEIWRLEAGSELRVPLDWLSPELRSWARESGSREALLEYGSDGEGEYAMYRLRAGEALYSSVVVRFTGLLEAEEVNSLAARIARRSGITDVTDIPIGFGVKIPLDCLSPEFQPPGRPESLAYELDRLLSSGYENPTRGRGLEGVTVVLDPGHGGRDLGAAWNGVWEDDYVYDIACRIKRLIEEDGGGRVIMTLHDRSSRWQIFASRRLEQDRDEEVVVTPAFSLAAEGSSTAGVNLRWALANYHHRQLTAQGVDPLRIVFTSLHADALHPAVRGAMIYVPGAEFGSPRVSLPGAPYAGFEECRACPSLDYSRRSRYRSEGLSRQLALVLLDSFRRRDLPVHGYRPIRDRVIRQKRAWSPAVLKNNVIPLKLLLEVCNIRNREDGHLLASPAFRQAVAEAYVQGLRDYFGGKG